MVTDWHSSWLITGDEGECGDPIFIDTAAPGYPVRTNGTGEGRWDPKPNAVALNGLREALAAVAMAAKHRKTPWYSSRTQFRWRKSQHERYDPLRHLRFSPDLQRPTSIEDQIRRCRVFNGR